MDIIEMTRELGKALQNDDRYIAYMLAKQANDDDTVLQALINGFENMRLQLNEELAKDDKDTERIKELDEGIKSNYKQIMENRNMIVFMAAQNSLESLVNNIQQIITLCANGSDPETCQPSTGCSGSCSTCGGCG
ncbi:MAG: YlbF family regulator [Ruminococcus flavefaciens]|nr:YlbF family regulator [Ruminococcus flavefaciens]MCM1229513.1 YlbF family regulator [Ruminococcus flavefaciens]